MVTFNLSEFDSFIEVMSWACSADGSVCWMNGAFTQWPGCHMTVTGFFFNWKIQKQTNFGQIAKDYEWKVEHTMQIYNKSIDSLRWANTRAMFRQSWRNRLTQAFTAYTSHIAWPLTILWLDDTWHIKLYKQSLSIGVLFFHTYLRTELTQSGFHSYLFDSPCEI